MGLAVTLVLLTGLVAIGAPPPVRLLGRGLPAAAAASGYLQARFKFCAGFGSKGIYNFGELGTTVQVEEAEARRRDRSRANQIGLASAAMLILSASGNRSRTRSCSRCEPVGI